jgi:hypothetical protein
MDFRVKETARKKIIEMLKHENKLRISDKYQEMYDNKQNDDDQEIVEKTLQKQVLRDFEYNDDTLEEYNSILSHYRDDEEVKNSVLYMKYNIVEECPIKIGETVPDSKIIKLDGTPCQLYDFLQDDRPTVILAGSIT